jgi:PPOX class probable F420-dependent enzyme
MLPDNLREFCTNNHQGVLTAFRRNGAAQMSIVTCGAYADGVAFTTTEDRAKLHNLRRNPDCSLLISADEWRPFVVLEGQARILSPGVTGAEELRMALRDVYRAAAGEEHSNWDEYDAAMVTDRRSAIIVVPTHTYGTGL